MALPSLLGEVPRGTPVLPLPAQRPSGGTWHITVMFRHAVVDDLGQTYF